MLASLGFAALIVARLAPPVVRGDDPVSPVTAMAHVPRFVRETPVLNDYRFVGYLQNYAAITAPDKNALAATLASIMCAGRFLPARRQC